MISKDEILGYFSKVANTFFIHFVYSKKKLLCVHGRCEYCIEQFVKCKGGETSEMDKRLQINSEK